MSGAKRGAAATVALWRDCECWCAASMHINTIRAHAFRTWSVSSATPRSGKAIFVFVAAARCVCVSFAQQ